MGSVNDLAGQLHDGALQELTLARLQLDLLSAGPHAPEVLERLREASTVLGEVSQRLQELMGIVQTSR